MTDPVLALIRQHRKADKAWNDHMHDDDSGSFQRQEATAFARVLATAPTTLEGCLASLRYVAEYSRANEAALFHDFATLRQPGAAYLPTIADALERLGLRHD